ncbi:BNR repeat-containing protein [Allonocardiopsis opalescens]|uniref:Putative BNR repeat neuraminidase n=1 Tax=Allonocardiopsis opalescens TaxID=1144618 RepID=A0A2T0QCQ9_9ACTN|nr:BNR repeat-containing protein [Allonocardiopsis opalescens]PRY01692.1 putative BNR repeat neuraminidase [Allonocardiopsis opalescens]
MNGTTFARLRRPAAAAALAAALLAPAGVPAAADTASTGAAAVGVTPLGSTTLDQRALYFVSYDGLVNNASYQQEGILTHGGRQYAAWYTADRTAVVARRDLRAPGSPWTTVRLPHRLSADDSHNSISLGISESDGRLHVAMDTHNTPIYYLRSSAGLVDRPGNSGWNAAAFGPVRRDLGGVDLGGISYPRFIPTPSGDLQFSYRTGGSGDGTLELAEYRGGSWRHLGAWTSPDGDYHANGSVSANRNMYLHGIGYDGAGRLHASFTWRETAAGGDILCHPGGLSNHDTGYVYSDDAGRTWRTDNGAVAAVTGTNRRVSVNTPGHVVDPLDIDQALMNQESQAVDSAGRPHVMISYVPGRFTHCVTDFAAQRRQWAHAFHLFRDAAGDWHKTELPVPVAAFGRTRLVLTPDDDAYAVLPGGRILAATAASGWSDWRQVYDGSGIDAFGEVLVDTARVDDGVLSILYQEPSQGRTPSPIRVADFALG